MPGCEAPALKSINSTSNTKVEYGGIGPPPLGPYPKEEGIINLALLPLDIN